MDFTFSEEQDAIRETARRFAEARLAPDYRQRETDGRIGRDLCREMGALGLIGAELPEAVGGLGTDCVTAGIIIEEVAAADINVAYVQLLGSLCGRILADHALPEVAGDWLPRLCRGEALIALALTEPQGGSDAANLRLKARRDGNGYVLDGEKTATSGADQADAAVVFARTGTAEERARGISAFLVPLDASGVTRTRFADMGERAVGRGSIHFDGVRVDAAMLLGSEGEGFRQVMQGFDYSRALIGLQCLAVARAALAETWAHVGERRAFDQPLAKFQGVTFPLVELDTQVAAARLLCWQTLWRKDRGLPHTVDAAMCKWWAPKVAFEAVQQCLLTHGHAGYSADLPYEQRLRDLLGLQIGDGTAQIMKLIVARRRVADAASLT